MLWDTLKTGSGESWLPNLQAAAIAWSQCRLLASLGGRTAQGKDALAFFRPDGLRASGICVAGPDTL
jgi:hypothetical protein